MRFALGHDSLYLRRIEGGPRQSFYRYRPTDVVRTVVICCVRLATEAVDAFKVNLSVYP